MSGWKTKLGSLIMAMSQILPGIFLQHNPELHEAATGVLASVGAGLTAWGLGHKIEKSTK